MAYCGLEQQENEDGDAATRDYNGNGGREQANPDATRGSCSLFAALPPEATYQCSIWRVLA